MYVWAVVKSHCLRQVPKKWYCFWGGPIAFLVKKLEGKRNGKGEEKGKDKGKEKRKEQEKEIEQERKR